MRTRLVAVATHPIQYHPPLFRRLAANEQLDFSVLFGHKPTPREQGEGFGADFEWDIDLTAGYRHAWMRNRAHRPSVVRFFGCNTPEVREHLAAERVDALLVMGWNSFTYIQATLAASRRGIPVLIRGDSQLGTERSGLKRLTKAAIYPWWIRRFAVCLAVGKRSAEYFGHYGARNIVWCPHSIDNTWFAERTAAPAAERQKLRERFGCSPEGFVFLFVGKLEEKKRPLDALEALRRCRERGLKVELLVAGDGELRQMCERFARRESAPARFLGFVNQSQMPAVYAASDALVLPSDARETWGLVVNEAMVCGLPAIVSDQAGCAPDLVTNQTGRVYPCGDVAALARSMSEMASDPSRARIMGARARQAVAAFSAERAEEGVMAGLRTIGFGNRAVSG